MKGEIKLDETYDSGVPGCPGTRFVIDLKKPPLQIEEDRNHVVGSTSTNGERGIHEGKTIQEKDPLPKNMLVLFVDDDMMIRKLFIRSIKRVAPGWRCEEAANGEKAIQKTQSKQYDLIFMDQYMASHQKQLLGTETVRAMRSQGCRSKICGLSANDMEQAFLSAGADFFLFKPFKCEYQEMQAELLRIVGPSQTTGCT